MAQEQAKTKANSLLEEVIALTWERHPSEFTLKRLQKQAEALRASNLFEASLALGMLASIALREAEMRTHHERALAIEEYDYLARSYYSASLQRLNCYSEAADWALRALELVPDVPNALRKAINACAAACRFSEASHLIEQWEKIEPDQPPPNEERVRGAIAYLKAHRIAEKDMQRLVDFARKFLRAEGSHGAEWGLHFQAGWGTNSMSYDIFLDEPRERVKELNSKLVRTLSAHPELQAVHEHVLVTYVEDED
jgi:hypothetical protein